ncbi:CitMHS family transporter [Mediterraneibacter sp. 210702-DFI.5.30]|uniref:CitMHS family transporter n=1 Tax=Mediterraneibacter sp. 210702-DFI.5.30 TaxID=2883232 RepID=UPI001D08C90C|nr:citrate:proton symporter [Mediterraneibacter sp. 210702-DFI.5.30]MCB6623107.1 citrate:proton symporter [Mediterraneibacter sp. 210702-DFI.5.30]
MVALIGFIMIFLIVFLLLKGKMSPIVVLALIPTIAALLLGFSPQEIARFIKDGISTTTSNGILFIFSVIYFGVMSDTGMFDVIVNFLVKKAGNNVIAVTVATAIIATIAHLDGTTATTVLITIPALYPVYKAMKIDTKILLCLTGACMGVMNLLPWGGPVARAATVLGMDANDLWHILIPIQIVGLVFNIVLAVLLGMLAVKQGAGAGKGEVVDVDEKAKEEEDALRRPKLLIFNLLLTIGLIVILSTGYLSSYVAFLLALSIALAVNYPDLKLQDKLIKKHAPAALIISATLFAAGAMVGIFDGTGMLTEMANALMSIIPDFMGRFIHIIFGIIALPLGLCIGTDAYFYGIMPLVMEVGQSYGVDALNTALTMVIGKNLALMVSPLVPATYLATGLANVELKDHMKFSIPWYWAISVIMIVIGIIFQIIPL